MQNCSLKELQLITKQILASSTGEAKIAITNLLNFYKQFHTNDSDKEIPTSYGVALSQKQAADCLNDYKRTHLFIKGIYRAIQKCVSNFNEEINILYAGCGPYATLLLPLIPLFKKQEIKITLIDVNEASINSIKRITSNLELNSYFSSIEVADAITYKFNSSKKLHLVVLHQYNEEYEIRNENTIQDRETVSELLTIDKFLNKSFSEENDFYESNWFTKKQEDIAKERPDMCLYTKVNIYEDITLKDQDSLITNPYCITSLYNLKMNTQFKVKYNLNNSPDWELIKR